MLRHRFLFEQMVRRELRQKYKGSVLGVLWYLVNPLVLMGAYSLMFSVVLKSATHRDYPLFLLCGIVVWVFFSQSLLAAATSLVEQAPLVKRVRFPREAIPTATVTVQLMTFGVLLALLIPVALAVRGSAGVALLLLPVVVAALFAFTLGLSLVVAGLHAHFRDVAPIVTAALLPWFFVSPIFFGADDFPGRASHPWLGTVLGWVNPIAPFIEGTRKILYDGVAPGWGTVLYVVVAGAVALAVGVVAFRRLERELAVIL
jgi:ABC-type polysaccharide/polyol phosphate export permease